MPKLLGKLIVILPFVLALVVFANVTCLAQDNKATQQEMKGVKIRMLLKHVDAITDEQKKLDQLYNDTLSIAKNMLDIQERETLYVLADRIEEANIRLEAPYSAISVYLIMLGKYEPTEIVNPFITRVLAIQSSYNLCLDSVNYQLSRTKKPAVALQCDKAKTEIRKCIDILDKASELFK